MFCLARKQSYTKVAAIVDVSPKTVKRAVLTQCKKTLICLHDMPNLDS